MEVVVGLSKTAIGSVLALAALAGTSHASEYPNRPVRIIVPYAAAGPTDASARLLAEALRPQLGQSVVIENKGGAGGIAGTEDVLRAAADGYTLLLGGAGPLVVSPAVNKTLRYDIGRDFVPVAQTWRSSQILAVHPKLGVKTLAELVAYGKANPGKLNVGSAGIGTLPHLSIEMLKRETGLDLTHVPFRGTGAALPVLLGGQIEMMFGDTAVLAPNVASKNLIGLAVTSPERSPLAPDLPTVAEAGFPALQAESWYGLLAPAKTPPAVLKRLQDAVQKALADPAYQENARKQGSDTVDTSSDKFAKLIASESEKWTPIVRAADIK